MSNENEQDKLIKKLQYEIDKLNIQMRIKESDVQNGINNTNIYRNLAHELKDILISVVDTLITAIKEE